MMSFGVKTQIRSIGRTEIFLGVVFFLFLWDVAYLVGLRNPYKLPHPFALFKNLGDVESLQGFSAMLRETIFYFASGSIIGIALGMLFLRRPWLSAATRRFLRLILWVPLIIGFAGAPPFTIGMMAVTLCACYHYMAGRSSLGLEPSEARIYAARDALLQALLVSLIAQLWESHWQWFNFTVFMKVGLGFEVFAVLAVLIGFINWCFRYDFEPAVDRLGAARSREVDCEGWDSLFQFVVFTAVCLTIWQWFSVFGLGLLPASPYRAAATALYLIFSGEIWRDIGLSLAEVTVGIILGGLAAWGVFKALSNGILKKLLFRVLPVSYISAIVLWLIAFVLIADGFGSRFIFFWHTFIIVGCLTFYPLIESFWGLRDRPVFCRILLAIDAALPVAFVAMAFGEAYAATQGLGFLMVVANATGQSDKTIGVCFVTVALMVGLSSMLRVAAKRVHASAIRSPILAA
jgi:ABC-type nitrate/sulfonate/bicarbonate transport system permease component